MRSRRHARSFPSPTLLGILLPVLAAAAPPCEPTSGPSGDTRPKGQIKADYTDARAQLEARKARHDRLETRLLEEGWTRGPDGDLVPPRGLDRGGQTKETRAHLENLEEEIGDLEARVRFNERVWRHRGWEIAELTRGAATRVPATPPPHVD